MPKSALMLEEIFSALPKCSIEHTLNSPIYRIFNDVAASAIQALFSDTNSSGKVFGPFGSLTFPYRKMGAIDSLDLFGLDELILFSFYWVNRRRYKNVLDIGANIGLHSIVMSKCGFRVDAYEPDMTHFAILKENLSFNNIKNVHVHNAAVSNRSGEAEFIRVLGNTTSSHLAGAKDEAYGDLEKYTVKIADIQQIIQNIDLIKMDVEGHEAEILCALSRAQLEKIDILAEIGSSRNAKLVFDWMISQGSHLFTQKNGWREIYTLEEMPQSYKDGTLFISSKKEMPWG